MRRRFVGRTHLIILLVYGLLAVLLTWPTVVHLATHLPGDGGDDPAIAWNLWWVKHALLTLRTNPLASDAMFYPIGINLAFYTLTTLNALTAMPLTLTLGVVAASNLHMWFTFVVGGYGAFLLARDVLKETRKETRRRGDAGTGGSGNQESGNQGDLLPTSYSLLPTPCSLWSAALAGAFYAFASSQLFYVALGQFNIASSHWVPYVILFVFKSRRDLRSLRWPALAALFLTMQAWTEMTYASFLLVFIALYGVYETIKSQIANPQSAIRNPQSAISHLKSPLVLVLLFTLGISPLLAAMLPDIRAEGDFFAQGSGFAEFFSADLAGFLAPTMHHPLLGGLVSRTGIANFGKGQHIYLGITLLILAGIGVGDWHASPLRRRDLGFWLLAALFFAWLALGPTIHVNGLNTGIPGPFVLLQSLPFFKGNRYPSRYSVLLVLSLAMLSAMGIETILRKVIRYQVSGIRYQVLVLLPATCCLLLGLFLVEHLSAPLPQSDMTVPAPYYAIAAEPGSFTLLDIPLAWRNGFRITGPLHPGFMFGQFYQTVHERPLLQGNTSRNPELKFQYFTEAPVINSILALETGHSLPPERWEADRALAGDVLRFFGVQYVVVRPGPGNDPAVTSEATLPYVEAVLPVERTYSDAALTVYRVQLPPLPKTVEISATAPLARLYLAEGWGAIAEQRMEKADTGPTARLPVLADGPGSSPKSPGAGKRMWAQRRTVRLFVPLAGGPQTMSFRIFAPGEGQRVTVEANGWRSAPVPLSPGWDEVRLTLPANAVRTGLNEIHLVFDRVYPVASVGPALLVQSAGEEVGDFGHIYVNGVDVSPNERGYNVAVISPRGDVQTASFDTHLDAGASAALAAFIAAVPDGYTVAVAAADEVSMNLGEEAVAALRSIGVAGDLRGKFRWSHAVIGVKGGGPGSALEALDGLRPVSVAAGPALTEPNVAAGVEWIQFEETQETE